LKLTIPAIAITVLSACATKPLPEKTWILHTYLPGDVDPYYCPSTIAKYGLADTTQLLALIYNVRGQIVDTLIDTVQGPGQYTVVWETDSTVASGVYFIRWSLNDSTMTRKFVLLK
jgi:hypothetical protein